MRLKEVDITGDAATPIDPKRSDGGTSTVALSGFSDLGGGAPKKAEVYSESQQDLSFHHALKETAEACGSQLDFNVI